MLSFEQKLGKILCSKHQLEILYVNIGQNVVEKRAMCKLCKCNDIQLHRNYLRDVVQEYIDTRRKEVISIIQSLQYEFNNKYDEILNTLTLIKEQFEEKMTEFSEKEYYGNIYEKCFGWSNLESKDIENIGQILSKDVEFIEDQVKIKQFSIDSSLFENIIEILNQTQETLNSLQLNNDKNMKLEFVLPKYDREISQLGYSYDEQMIAVVTLNSDIDIWNVETMKKITLKGHDDIVNALIFSNNSNTLITGGREGIIKVWKYDNKWIIHDILIGHDDWITGLAIGKYDQLIASASNENVFIWQCKQDHFSIIKKLEGHTNSIYSLDFLADCKILITGSYDKKVRLWQCNNKNQWEFKQQFYYHSEKVASIACSNNTIFGSCSWDQSIRLYDQMTDDTYDCVQVLYGHQGKVYQIQFSKNSKILYSSSHDNTIKLWSQLQTNLWECFHEIKQDFHIKQILVRQNYLISSNYYEVYVYKQLLNY